jgi:hypothetical protein
MRALAGTGFDGVQLLPRGIVDWLRLTYSVVTLSSRSPSKWMGTLSEPADGCARESSQPDFSFVAPAEQEAAVADDAMTSRAIGA